MNTQVIERQKQAIRLQSDANQLGVRENRDMLTESITHQLELAAELTYPVEASELSTLDWTNPASFGGKPILFDVIETPEIDSDFLPPWIKAQVDAVAEYTQTPKEIAIMYALAILGSCFQQKFAISPYGDDCDIEPLNMWTLASLPSAICTTKVLDALRAPILNWEQAEAKETAIMTDRCNIDKNIRSKQIQMLTRVAGKVMADNYLSRHQAKMPYLATVSPIKPDELTEMVYSIMLNMPTPKPPRKIIFTDLAQNDLLRELVSYEQIAVITDQQTAFETLVLNARKTNPDLLFRGYTGLGGPVRIPGKSVKFTEATTIPGRDPTMMIEGQRDIYLNKIAITLGLTVQPEVLTTLRNDSKRSVSNSKLFSNFIYFMPRSNIGHRRIINKKIIPLEVKKVYENGMRAILAITPVLTGNFSDKPILLTLSAEALELWEQFSEWLESELGTGGKLEQLQGWAANLPKQVLRITALCHIANLIKPVADTSSSLSSLSRQYINNNLTISKETIDSVLKLSMKLIVHAQAAFNLIDDDKLLADAQEGLKWLVNHTERGENGGFYIRKNALHSNCSRFKNSSVKRLEKVLDILSARNIISPVMKMPIPHPANICHVNPALLDCQMVKDKMNLINQHSQPLPYLKTSRGLSSCA